MTTILSRLKKLPSATVQCLNIGAKRQLNEAGEKFTPVPSRWMWHKFKDMCHFYVFIGLVPCVATATYCNIFIGPATLKPIPEGYDPKDEEYQRHPITRFITRYLWSNYREMYEKTLHLNWLSYERYQIRTMERRVEEVINRRRDVQGYKFHPVMTKYHKRIKHVWGDAELRRGGVWSWDQMDE